MANEKYGDRAKIKRLCSIKVDVAFTTHDTFVDELNEQASRWADGKLRSVSVTVPITGTADEEVQRSVEMYAKGLWFESKAAVSGNPADAAISAASIARAEEVLDNYIDSKHGNRASPGYHIRVHQPWETERQRGIRRPYERERNRR